jgi:hypothetical protein
MNEFLSGAVTMGFLIAALFFLRFRRRKAGGGRISVAAP